jgi:hypothetical protein
MEVVPSRIIVSNGVVQNRNMQVNVGNRPLNFQGTIGLDEKLDMTIVTPYVIDMGEGIRKVTIEEADQVKDRIAVPLGGTLRKPEVNVEKILESIMESTIKGALQKGLQDLFQ